jgi:hypothetical protein
MQKHFFLGMISFFLIGLMTCLFLHSQRTIAINNGVIKVKKTADFIITGEGSAENWNTAEWNVLPQHSYKTLRNNNWQIPADISTAREKGYATSFKILYSHKGIYCLYKCEDSAITATLQSDFLNLYDEDVVEAFFWTDTTMPVYFEYELSPLNFELPILIVNNQGNVMGWRPWQYEGNRKTIHAIKIGKEKNSNKNFTWTAEFFIPFALLNPLNNVPPSGGTTWRANFYRIDYDGSPRYSSWQLTRQNYHDYEKFGTLVFE